MFSLGLSRLGNTVLGKQEFDLECDSKILLGACTLLLGRLCCGEEVSQPLTELLHIRHMSNTMVHNVKCLESYVLVK